MIQNHCWNREVPMFCGHVTVRPMQLEGQVQAGNITRAPGQNLLKRIIRQGTLMEHLAVYQQQCQQALITSHLLAGARGARSCNCHYCCCCCCP
eukprot:1657439-Amphidinium_carterae.1